MPRRTRALLLDLDDTLYPQCRFLFSGLAAVAHHVAERCSVDQGCAFRFLMTSYNTDRGHELDRLVEQFELTESVGSLVAVIREHTPALTLQPATLRTLRELRRSWQLGIVTNGVPAIQAAKVAALGVDRLVDTVVYATEHGSGTGKPEPDPFLEALRRLDMPAAQAIFVGDDEMADMFGATECGMQAIQTLQWKRPRRASSFTRAAAHVHDIVDVPAVAGGLLSRRRTHYAA
ncbi:MAG: HAD family hydrolase [Vicinamibacterales bacterium]